MIRIAGLMLACALLASACVAGEEPTVVRAVFPDVIDLVERAAVKIADVDVGRVDSIELTDGNDALVTMSVDPALALPAVVTAQLRKTAVLGERYVALVPDRSSGGTFTSGGMVAETVVVPELEEAIASGTEVVAAIAADTFAGAIEAGATGLTGRGETLGGVLTDLQAVVEAYDDNSADLVRLLDGLDQFLAEAGPQADLHGRAVEQLAVAAAFLAEEDERVLDALTQVSDLAADGNDIIVTHRQRIDDFFTRFQRLTSELVEPETELDRLFDEVSKHNYNTIRGINSEFAQVLLDFIVCGVNDEPGDQLRTCEPPPSARPVPQPRPPQDY